MIHSDAFYQVQHEYYNVDPDGIETRAADDCYTSEPIADKHGDIVNASNIAADVNGKTNVVTYTEVSRTPENITLDKNSTQTITITYKRYQYNVTYEYTGNVPDNAPDVPKDEGMYVEGTQKIVAAAPTLEGYTFSGWTTSDTTVADGAFIMPGNNVVFTGSWTENSKYEVTYQYTGTVPANAPDLPVDNTEYYEGDEVSVADVPTLEGYTFTGWTTSDATITDGKVTMPAKNVVFTGSWEKLPSYQVIINYHTITDGETPVLDHTIKSDVVYGKENAVYTYRTTHNRNQYGGAELAEGKAELDAASATLSNITPADPTNQVVVNLYRSVTTPVQYQVKHEYYLVDLNGTRTLVEADGYTSDPVTRNHGDTVEASGLTEDPNGKTDAVKYTEVSRTPESIKLDKTSTEMQIITITYERYQAPITVHYVDSQGASMKEDYTDTLYAGDAYDLNTEDVQISEILKDGVPYDFAYDSTDTAYSGILTRDGVEITRVYLERGKAFASVRYVDENGNPLQMPLITDEMYIGDPYDVTEALQVKQIILGGSEYAFDHHYQMRAPVRSVGSLTFVEDVDYSGAMPAGGIEITRVYRLDKVTYYYQQKNVYTAYDADGNVLYSATDEQPVTASQESGVTIALPESCEHNGYGFWRVSEETMTADLTDTAPDKPYVFVAYYEFRQGDEPVPDTQLPPGITVPEKPQPAVTAPVESLPPRTGDEGVALWQWLMVLAGAGLALLLAAQRKVRREEP